MKGDTTPMRVLLVVDSSTGYLGATDVDQKGGRSGFAAKWMAKWLESTGYARIQLTALVKSHASQGHVERVVRLVDNQYRALLFHVQERTRVKIDPISAASSRILRHSVWLLNRYQPHKGRATSFERLIGGPYRSPILPLFAMVECLVPSDPTPGGVLVVAERADQCGFGRTKESDEQFVVNETGCVVRVRTVRRCV